MAKDYRPPLLVEYGTVEQLTLGSGGNKPDYDITGGKLVLVSSSCDAVAPAFACLVEPPAVTGSP